MPLQDITGPLGESCHGICTDWAFESWPCQISHVTCMSLCFPSYSVGETANCSSDLLGLSEEAAFCISALHRGYIHTVCL